MKDINIAIIVLNYNDSANTTKFVKDIYNYDIITKIIVVDNKSTNINELENLNKLKSEKVDVVVSDKNGGYSYGNNFGLKYLDEKCSDLEFKYVIISNPDVSVEEGSIKKCIEFMETTKDAIITAPRMYFANGPARRSAWKHRTFLIDFASSTRTTQAILFPVFKSGEYTKKDFSNDVLKVDSVAGSFFVAKHKEFKEIGYFDENTFLFFEEDIIAAKFKEKGFGIYSLNNIRFMHYESLCIGKLYSLTKKKMIEFNSRDYFHTRYNNIGKFKLVMLKCLRYLKKLELIFEVPIRKLIEK